MEEKEVLGLEVEAAVVVVVEGVAVCFEAEAEGVGFPSVLRLEVAEGGLLMCWFLARRHLKTLKVVLCLGTCPLACIVPPADPTVCP